MPIRPIDVRRKEFRNGFRGYDANQVDDFLDAVADEFERTYTENSRLREEVSSLRESLQQFEELEGSIRRPRPRRAGCQRPCAAPRPGRPRTYARALPGGGPHDPRGAGSRPPDARRVLRARRADQGVLRRIAGGQEEIHERLPPTPEDLHGSDGQHGDLLRQGDRSLPPPAARHRVDRRRPRSRKPRERRAHRPRSLKIPSESTPSLRGNRRRSGLGGRRRSDAAHRTGGRQPAYAGGDRLGDRRARGDGAGDRTVLGRASAQTPTGDLGAQPSPGRAEPWTSLTDRRARRGRSGQRGADAGRGEGSNFFGREGSGDPPRRARAKAASFAPAAFCAGVSKGPVTATKEGTLLNEGLARGEADRDRGPLRRERHQDESLLTSRERQGERGGRACSGQPARDPTLRRLHGTGRLEQGQDSPRAWPRTGRNPEALAAHLG